MEDERFVSIFNEASLLGLVFVVSHHHLTEICLSSTPQLFVNRLEKIPAYFLSTNQSSEIARSGTTRMEPINAQAEITKHLEHIAGFEQEFLQALFPLLKLAGGLDSHDVKSLTDDFVRSMWSSVGALLKESGPVGRIIIWPYFALKLKVIERQVRSNISSVDFASEAKKFRDIRQKIFSIGNISQIPAEDVVEKVLGELNESEAAEIRKEFPPNFAVDPIGRSSKVAAFAFLLFAIGAVPGSGKVFRGDSAGQRSRFRAQYLDCLHIGEASLFDGFLTCDAGANRLASVVYGYAGVKTLALKLETSQRP